MEDCEIIASYDGGMTKQAGGPVITHLGFKVCPPKKRTFPKTNMHALSLSVHVIQHFERFHNS